MSSASQGRSWSLPGRQLARMAAQAVIDLLFPPRCTACGQLWAVPGGAAIRWCPSCHVQLAVCEKPHCPRCAALCSVVDRDQGDCPQCRGQRLAFAAARTIGPYQGALRQAVLRSKQAAHHGLAIDLGRRLGEALDQHPFPQPPDLVVPVPMFWLRRLWRQHHHALRIAQGLAQHKGWACVDRVLVCRRYLRRQTNLSADQRWRNVRGAFAARSAVAGKSVLVVDDVMTTGATAQEAARTLLAAGAACVFVATVARSKPQ